MTAIGLGLRALRGGAAAVAVALEKGEPRVVLSSFLATSVEGDRLAYEPYHVACEMKRGPDGRASVEAAAAVAEGRKRQDALAEKGLRDIIRTLRKAGCEPVVAALLINRAGWIPDLLAYSLFDSSHAPVAEGLAVREALRLVLGRIGIEIAELDEKSLPDLASAVLEASAAGLDARLKVLGAGSKPWRKEQKLACLAAWLAVSNRAA